ncbi:MAG TPA: hypothetical protein PLP56_01225 [Candidatus Omnitrophota bacterium]|nr:hypothetical protein [Candidatus Omnitrophota bacterium]HNQ51214.1 hypothetical protein [Candidatus Omnitrophota bacterium]HQO37996.1 hypothetical protein [Candidatus Omnitrophota bacterium]HQQ05587.1 hypothetical protein [Candidatus Omnitrophota bacterium]
MKMAYLRGTLGAVLGFVFFAAGRVLAADVTLLFTGETHAMLYPCSCPVEVDGGVARRATLVKDIRTSSPNVLLVDSGAFCAGGLMDEYTQSAELDMIRTETALKAMEYMQYDAAAVGGEEFNFGRQFIEDAARKYRFAFVSANCDVPGVAPFVVRAFPGVKVGLIGATPLSARPKTGGLEIRDPKAAVAGAITRAKAAGADCIVLLSRLGEADDLELIKTIEGIDVVVIGGGRLSQEPFSKAGATLLLRPSWQGRRMGKAALKIEDRAIVDFKVEEIRLSDSIAADPQVLGLGPRCFMDSNCKQGARTGTCEEPGTKNARCVFGQDVKVPVTVVVPKNCYSCEIDQAVDSFRKGFPGIAVTRVPYPGPQAQKLIDDLGLTTLPAYIFGPALAQDPGYEAMKDRFEEKNGFFLLKPQFGGVAMFLGRPAIPGKIDVFLSLYDPHITTLLYTLEEFDPQIHFLAARKNGELVTVKGVAELEEMKRCVCVKKHYPAYFWNYLNCRVRHIESSWWQDCLGMLDPAPVKDCAQGVSGTALLEENIAMNEELQIVSSPTYVVHNQNIFSSKLPPSKEEFRKIFTAK